MVPIVQGKKQGDESDAGKVGAKRFVTLHSKEGKSPKSAVGVLGGGGRRIKSPACLLKWKKIDRSSVRCWAQEKRRKNI